MLYMLPAFSACPRTCLRWWALPDPCPWLSSFHASHHLHGPHVSWTPLPGNPLIPYHPLVSPQNCISSLHHLRAPPLQARALGLALQCLPPIQPLSRMAHPLSFQTVLTSPVLRFYRPTMLQRPVAIPYSSCPWAPSPSPRSGTLTMR